MARSAALPTAGVTGTNGKTTTVFYLSAVLQRLGAVLSASTFGYRFVRDGDSEDWGADRTWDGFVAAVARAREAGASWAAIELTSEALARGFAAAWPCEVGVFTNLTRDHLDAHGSAEHYLASKAQLFMHLPPDGVAILNAADPAAALLAEVLPEGVKLLRYGLRSRGDCAPDLDATGETTIDWDGTAVQMPCGAIVRVAGIGDVYAENALAAFLAGRAVGLSDAAVVDALAQAPTPPGRFQVVTREPYTVVDYGHSPDALRRTLHTAKRLAHGSVTVVVGAGGGSDPGKRPQMGEAADEADRVIFTDDNPRDEDPGAIVAALREGCPRAEVIHDRVRAIETAVRDAHEHDVVVVSGRGPETVQVVGAIRRPLVDADVVERAWRTRP